MAEDVTEDYHLLTELVSGDFKAFNGLYKKYHPALYNFSMWLSKNRHEAEELVQSTFVTIWENRRYIDPEKQFRTYLFNIARNRFFDILRKRNAEKFYVDYILQHDNQEADDLHQQIEDSELHQIIEKLLQQVPERRQHIFRLSRDENLSYKQIAETLQISENTVDTQIRNVLNFLRKELPKYYK